MKKNLAYLFLIMFIVISSAGQFNALAEGNGGSDGVQINFGKLALESAGDHSSDVTSEKNQNENNSKSELSAYKYIIYYVQSGDSLYRIASKYGTSINSIMELNHLNSYMIYPGQKLVLSVVDNSNIIIYTVKPGDSLYLISLKYHVSINSIRTANKLKGNMIYVGQKLEIPAAEGSGNNETDSNNGNTKSGSENSNDGSNNTKTYKSISGTAVLNNKTGGTQISRQSSELDNKVFPLYKAENDADYREKEIIVKYKPMVNSQSVDKFEKENKLVTISSVERPEGKIVKYQIPEDRKIDDLLTEYNSKKNVAWAEPNYIYYPTAIPQDEYYNGYQWNMVDMDMEAAWDVTKGDRSVLVAVLDTGIIPDHPDLKDNLVQGADFVGGDNSYPIQTYKATDFDPTDESSYQEGGSHGTHVAGIIGALSNNKQGVAGVNWNIRIMPIRALTRTGGTSWDIAEGIYYAIDQGVDIINMSFGGSHDSYYQHEAVKDAVTHGITIVAATGNDGKAVYYPAAYPETIAVGAVGRKNIKTGYSNYGPEVDIVAPGGDYGESILSTWGYYKDGSPVPGYNGMIGTSMATPHITGVAALLAASGIDNPEEIRSRLVNTARDLGEKGKDDYYGYGLVDAYGALTNQQVKNPSVFAANKINSTLEVKSEIVNAADDGSFKLSQVESDADYIIAWFDGNDDGKVDGGDFYGEIDNTAGNGSRINMNYIAKVGGNTYYQISK